MILLTTIFTVRVAPLAPSTLILYVDKGIYEFDVNIGTYKIRENCKIFIKTDGLNENESYEHISVYLFKKNVSKR